jgi:hypothetical protein
MEGWYYTLIFCFSILVVVKNLANFIMKLMVSTPKEYNIGPKELILLGVSISYILTYLIY